MSTLVPVYIRNITLEQRLRGRREAGRNRPEYAHSDHEERPIAHRHRIRGFSGSSQDGVRLSVLISTVLSLMISRLNLLGMEFWCARRGCSSSPAQIVTLVDD